VSAKPIIIPAVQEPTLWNSAMSTGFRVGAIPVLAAIAAALPMSWPVLGLFAATSMIGGALVGGYFGKSQMQQEVITGHAVNPPTLFNKGMLDGLVNGVILGIFGYMGASLLTASGASLAGASWVMPALAGGATVATGGLMYLQGKETATDMSRQYAQAQILTQPPAPEKSKGGLSGMLSSLKGMVPQMQEPQESAQQALKTNHLESLLKQRQEAELLPPEARR